VASKVNRFEALPQAQPTKVAAPPPTQGISAKAAKLNESMAKSSEQPTNGEVKFEFTKAEKKKIMKQLEKWVRPPCPSPTPHATTSLTHNTIQPAAAAFQEPIKVGWLQKRKGITNSWKKYYLPSPPPIPP